MSVISIHQLDLPTENVVPMKFKMIVPPQTIESPSLLSRTLPAASQEKVSIVGSVTNHSSWESATKTASALLRTRKAKYNLFCQDTTPVRLHKFEGLDSSVTTRGAIQEPLTALTVDQIMNMQVKSLGNTGQVVLDAVEAETLTQPQTFSACCPKVTEQLVQLHAGIPKSGTVHGRPMVVIDNVEDGTYVVYGIWAIATFEGIVAVDSDSNAPKSFLGFLRSVLGLVETVIHVVEDVVKIVEAQDFVVAMSTAGKTTIISNPVELARYQISESELAQFVQLYANVVDKPIVITPARKGKRKAPRPSKQVKRVNKRSVVKKH